VKQKTTAAHLRALHHRVVDTCVGNARILAVVIDARTSEAVAFS